MRSPQRKLLAAVLSAASSAVLLWLTQEGQTDQGLPLFGLSSWTIMLDGISVPDIGPLPAPVPVPTDDLPPVVRPPFKFVHADTLTGAKVKVSGAGGRYPSALCGRCVLY